MQPPSQSATVVLTPPRVSGKQSERETERGRERQRERDRRDLDGGRLRQLCWVAPARATRT